MKIFHTPIIKQSYNDLIKNLIIPYRHCNAANIGNKIIKNNVTIISMKPMNISPNATNKGNMGFM